MSILTIAYTCAARLQIPPPSGAFLSSTDNNMILLKAMLEEAAQDLVSLAVWTELESEHTFTLATDTPSYALPADFDRVQNDTLWNRTQRWPLIGPLDAVLWQVYKSGLITTVPRQRFRVKGWSNAQFFIDPTPSSDENGQTCAFEYITQTCIRPKTWVASTSWTGIQYCSYNGYIFDRGAITAATTGTSAPTPSSLNDGSITWSLYTSPFQTFTNDTDNLILNEKIVIDRAIWRFKQERGLDFEDLRRQANELLEIAITDRSGASVLYTGPNNVGYPPILGINNYPQGNF